MIVHSIDLDLVPCIEKQVICLSRGDKEFTLVFNIFARNGSFSIEQGTTVELNGTRPDLQKCTKPGVIDGTTVTIDGDTDITAVEGKGIFELTFTKDGKRMSTSNFIINIEEPTTRVTA